MSAATLRRAAKTARDEWAGEETGPFKHAARIHLAVADWLDDTAEFFNPHSAIWGRALAVARAYLGESA